MRNRLATRATAKLPSAYRVFHVSEILSEIKSNDLKEISFDFSEKLYISTLLAIFSQFSLFSAFEDSRTRIEFEM